MVANTDTAYEAFAGFDSNGNAIPVNNEKARNWAINIERSLVDSASVTKKTWSDLSAITGAEDGQRGYVEDDAGTHADPVTSATVDNEGIYSWVDSSSAWQRVGDKALSAEVSDLTDALDAEETERANADTTLQSNIDTEAEARANAVTTLTNADETLQTNINTEATARADADTATNEKIDESLPVSDTASGAVPVITDGGKVIAAIVNGKLETIPRADQQLFFGRKNIPVLTDGEKVLMWLEGGELNTVPVTRDFTRKIEIASTRAATFGASLSRWRATLAKFKTDQSVRVKILIIGDSWVEQSPISAAIKAVLGGTLAAESFRPTSVGTWREIGDATFEISGAWNEVDGSNTTTYPYGVGPSGHQIWTDATDGTILLSNVLATDIKIYRHNHGGTWRYRVDGDAWVTVSDAADGLMDTVTISGLPDTEHTLEIDTVGNSGVVAMDGFYSWRGGVNGFELIRLGNSGVTSVHQSHYHEPMVQFIGDLQPDIIFTILGTNDQYWVSEEQYYSAFIDLINRTRAVQADAGFVHIVPPETNGALVGEPTHKLAEYRDATMRVVRDAGTEYLSLLDLMGGWETENANGIWNDWGHLNLYGGRMLAELINDKFLKI